MGSEMCIRDSITAEDLSTAEVDQAREVGLLKIVTDPETSDAIRKLGRYEADAISTMFRLLRLLEVDQSFIPALMDWIDADFDIRYPDGMEENYEDYRVANREMVDISELLLVHNVTPEIFEKLQPHITALPGTSTLNVNTMSEVIFLSLAPDLDVTEFTQQREDEPYDSIEEFIERMQIPVQVDGLSVDTRYFRAHGQVMQGEQVYNLASLIYRDPNGSTRVINRTLGQF